MLMKLTTDICWRERERVRNRIRDRQRVCIRNEMKGKTEESEIELY